MQAFSWTEAAHGAIVADGKRLEAMAFGPPPDAAPTLVLLHEGLGCVALWRGFPEGSRRRRAAGSSSIRAPVTAAPIRSTAAAARLHDPRGALQPACRSGGDRVSRGVLIGHSDGASIAAIYAGDMRMSGSRASF